jgi:nucleotide-binding universal stress UspA family protein
MKILLAIDSSEFSSEALHMIVSQFQRQGTEILVLHVVEPLSVYMSADLIPHLVTQVAEVEDDRRGEANDLVRRSAAELLKAGFKASEAVDEGLPKTTIIERAHNWGADLIVMGSHGLTGLNRFLMGSVSEAVCRHAHCSVEVVRRKPKEKGGSTHG